MLLLASIIDLENDHENQVVKYLVHTIRKDQMLVPTKKYKTDLITKTYCWKKIHILHWRDLFAQLF